MKLLFFSDLHLGTGVFKGKDSTKSDMLGLGLGILRQILELAREQKATVLFGGDWFDQPISVNIKAMNASIELLNYYPDVQIYAISGNHDLSSKAIYKPDWEGDYRYPYTSLSILQKACSNFHLQDNHAYYHFGSTDVKVWFMPFYQQGFDECLEDMVVKFHEPLDYNILLMHQTPVGNSLNLPPDTTYDYDLFDQIFCGHIHKPSHSGNLCVMGNPYQRDAGDYGQHKYVYLFDTNHKSFKWVLLDYPEVASSDYLIGREAEFAFTEECLSVSELTEVYQSKDKVAILESYCENKEVYLNYIKKFL